MIYEFGTEQVNQKLCEKEESGYQSNITERNMVVTVKFQKKKRCEVCRNSLCDKPHITGRFLSYGSLFFFIEFLHLKIISIPLFFFLLDYIANIRYIH